MMPSPLAPTFFAALLLAGCTITGADGGAVDTPVPNLDIVDAPTDDNGHYPIDIVDGTMKEWPERITRLPRGPSEILLRNGSEHPEDENTSGAIALWLRGRGSRRHFLPMFASRPLFPQTMEDWSVDLKPGTYELSVSLGGDPMRTAIVVVD